MVASGAALVAGADGSESTWVLILSIVVVLLLIGVIGQHFYIRCVRKNARAAVTKMPMMAVVTADTTSAVEMASASGLGGGNARSAPELEFQLPPPPSDGGFVDISLAAQRTPAPTSGTRNTAAKARAAKARGSKSRDSDDATVSPVVMHVPLPDLDKPIMANLDANHQIESIRPDS